MLFWKEKGKRSFLYYIVVIDTLQSSMSSKCPVKDKNTSKTFAAEKMLSIKNESSSKISKPDATKAEIINYIFRPKSTYRNYKCINLCIIKYIPFSKSIISEKLTKLLRICFNIIFLVFIVHII